MKQIKVIVERGSDGIYTAVPQHDYSVGFFGSGKTVAQAMDDLRNSYAEAREFCPEMDEEVGFDLRYDTASFLQYYGRKLTLTGLESITGINYKQLNHYVTGRSKPSVRTKKRLEEGVKRFAQELSEIQFL